MNDSKQKTYNLTVYLIKDIRSTKEKIKAIDQKTVEHEVSFVLGNQNDSTLYIKKTSSNKPDWIDLLAQSNDVSKSLFEDNQRIGAAIELRVCKRTFFVTFGSGYSMINQDAIERDFGLRVALNGTDSVELRSIDKSTNSTTPLNSRSQSTLGVDIDSLLIDTESDLLFALTGKSKIAKLGTLITGRDSLNIKPKLKLDELPDVLETALELYEKKLPKNYEWVDNIRKVRDPSTNEKLINQLISLIDSNRHSNIWLGEPEIIDWSVVEGFQFGSRNLRHETLTLEKLLKHIRSQQTPLSAKLLDCTTIYCKASDGTTIKKWSATRCLYAEIKFNGKTYILRDGIWYKVDQSFVNYINRAVTKIKGYDISLPDYEHLNEADYNRYVAKSITNAEFLDANNVSYGGGRSKIEFCDLLINKSDFVHVKRYAGSQPLSHLFNQGYVAAETFKRSKEFRKAVNKKLPTHAQLPVSESSISSKKFKVVYAICTSKSSLPEDLPFFSKVALKKTEESLRIMGFSVHIAKISFSKEFMLRSKGKSQASKRKKTAA